jgi:hypothetical protein
MTHTDEQVERVARAICAAKHNEKIAELTFSEEAKTDARLKSIVDEYETMARAALSAMPATVKVRPLEWIYDFIAETVLGIYQIGRIESTF